MTSPPTITGARTELFAANLTHRSQNDSNLEAIDAERPILMTARPTLHDLTLYRESYTIKPPYRSVLSDSR